MEKFDDCTGGKGLIFGSLAVIVAAMIIAVLGTGCAYKGAKVVEGTDLAIGLNLPMTEGTMQLQVLNYLSGFRLGVDRNADLSVRYTVAETNDYLGCVHTRVFKTIDATVEPVAEYGETNAPPETASN